MSGTAATAALAGCSSQDGSSSTERSPQPESTPEATTSGQEKTVTEEQTEPEQEQLYEEDQSSAEADFETGLSNNFLLGWVEMENPEEQLPEENLDDKTYPSLRAITDQENGIDPYEPGEAFYLCFGEEGPQVVIGATKVDGYGESGDLDAMGVTSGGFTDEDADIVGILEDVVEGYDDVSRNMNDDYVEALQS